jgi:hypothetical protein
MQAGLSTQRGEGDFSWASGVQQAGQELSVDDVQREEDGRFVEVAGMSVAAS